MLEIYEKLRARLDMFPQGFPKTKSGVEIEILEHLFSPEEAEIALSMRPYIEAVATIAERTGRDEKKLVATLYDMSKRGLILRYTESEEKRYYALAPWMIGIWEFQLNALTDENIKLYEKFYLEGMVQGRQKVTSAGFRVIPIEEEIQQFKEVQPFERISEIINGQTRFAVAPCICRKEAKMMGEGCDKLMEACMMFGVAADYYIENELAREITKEEALQVLDKAEEDGLIHFSSNHTDDKIFICNCCGCCCKALANLVKYDNPHAIGKSNYYALLDKDSCTDCEDCLERCQVNAIQFEDDSIVIQQEKCIGCGLCMSACPTEAISMVAKSPENASPIFTNNDEMLQAIGKERNKPFPFE